jgi:hypothetical protein
MTEFIVPNEDDRSRRNPEFAEPIQNTLRAVLEACLAFARA